MTTHRTVQNNLFSFIKGELSPKERRAVETHVQSCDVCASELQSMRTTMDLLAKKARRPSAQRSELYWQQFADKVEGRLRDESVEETSPSFVSRLLDSLVENRKPFGVGFASALSLMALAFAIWSLWIKAPESDRYASEKTINGDTQELRSSIQKTALEARTDEYLEQSKVLLIGILNADPQSLGESKPLLQRQREVSKRLVRESEEISSGLTDPSQQRLKELVSDLGVILLQIANLEAEHGMQGVAIVKSGVERNGILFKINLEEIQRTRQTYGNKGSEKSAKSTI